MELVLGRSNNENGILIHKALENKLKHISCHGNLGYESNIGFNFLLTKK